MNTESFVFYESVYKQAERLEKKLGKEVGYDFLKAVIEFGLYGVVPDDDDNAWLYGLEQTITSIGAAKDRYAAAVENGKKGGRKKIELNQEEVMKKKAELKTWKAVAAFYKVDEDTLRKIRKQWEKAEKPKNLNDDNVNVNEKEKEKAEKPKNLNDNVNVNVNDNVNEKEEEEGKTLKTLKNPKKPQYNDNVNDNVNDNEKENEKKDFSYLYDEVGCDGYIRKEKKWIDRMCWNFRAMSAQERIEYIETLDFSHEEAEYIVNNILEI